MILVLKSKNQKTLYLEYSELAGRPVSLAMNRDQMIQHMMDKAGANQEAVIEELATYECPCCTDPLEVIKNNTCAPYNRPMSADEFVDKYFFPGGKFMLAL